MGTERSGPFELTNQLDHPKEQHMPGIDFDRLRREISMEQVLVLLGFEPTRRTSDQWYGACPLHGTKTGTEIRRGHRYLTLPLQLTKPYQIPRTNHCR